MDAKPQPPNSSHENTDDREQRLNLLRKIQLPARCTGWDRKFPVRTFDFIPQDARPDLREVYYTALTMINKVQLGVSDEDSQQQTYNIVVLLRHRVSRYRVFADVTTMS